MSKKISKQILSILSTKPSTAKSKILSLLMISASPLSPSDIAKKLQLAKGTVTGTLTLLKKRGFITRVKSGYLPKVPLFELVLYIGQDFVKQELRSKK